MPRAQKPATSPPSSVHTQKGRSVSKDRSNVATSVNLRKDLQCLCGCGLVLIPRDARQKYLPGHRYSAYKTHACPDCQGIHRIRVANGQAT